MEHRTFDKENQYPLMPYHRFICILSSTASLQEEIENASRSLTPVSQFLSIKSGPKITQPDHTQHVVTQRYMPKAEGVQILQSP